MKTDRELTYVKIQGFYLCLEKNWISMAFLLLIRSNPFSFDTRPSKKIFKYVPLKIIKVIRIILIIAQILKLKYIRQKDIMEFKAPFEGHILIKTSNGYKVFNLKKQTVITQFRRDINGELFKTIIHRYKKVQGLGLAPKILEIDYDKNSIMEEYYNYYRAKRFYPIDSYFYTEIFPVWKRSIECYQIRNVKLESYIREQVNFILNKTQILEQQGYDRNMLDEIKNYIINLSNEILLENNPSKIHLTITHGDLHAWNILIKGHDAVVIDWDTVKERTLYHDLYYMFIHNVFGKADVNFKELLESFRSCYMKINCKLENKLSANLDEHLYRKVFYLEYIQLDFEQRLGMYDDKKRNIGRLKNIIECIESFNAIEKNTKKKIFINFFQDESKMIGG